MARSFPKLRAAAVQAAPVFLDLDATVEKTCALIEQAADRGANLVAFPEAYIPAYPWWVFLGSPGEYAHLYAELYKNSVQVPSNAVRKISETARKAEIYVSVSVNELDGGSLYLTQLWFDPRGNLMGKHRKLKLSVAERYIWGEGDGSMVQVYDTEIGRLGGLQCWEHMVPVNIAAMNSLNEQVHVSAWPAFSAKIGHMFTATPNTTAATYYAMTAQCYNLMTTQIITQEMIDKVCLRDEHREIFLAGGGAAQIISPEGIVISNRVPENEEGFAIADIDLESIIYAKYVLDPAGHYSVPGSISLTFNREPQPPVRHIGQEKDYSISYDQLNCESLVR